MINRMDSSNEFGSLSEGRLAAFEQILGCRLPEDYRRFLLTHNGGRPRPAFFRLTESDGGDVAAFYGLHGKASDVGLDEVRVVLERRLAKELLAVGSDSLGNQICIGLAGPWRGHVRFWDHESERTQPIAVSFTAFLDSLLECGELPDAEHAVGPARRSACQECPDASLPHNRRDTGRQVASPRFLKSVRVGADVAIAASFSSARVLVARYDTARVLYDVRLEADCRECFDVSAAASVLVTAWQQDDDRGLEIRKLRTGRVTLRRAALEVLDLALGPSGDHVLYLTTGGVFCLREPSVDQLLVDALPPSLGSLARDGNEFLLPTRRHGWVYRVRDPACNTELVQWPVAREIWGVSHSPTDDAIIVLDDLSEVHMLESGDFSPRWAARVPEGGSVCFSGNGRLIAVDVCTTDRHEVVALDASTGAVLDTYAEVPYVSGPWRGDSVLCSSGEILDLASGHVDEGVSAPQWWVGLG